MKRLLTNVQIKNKLLKLTKYKNDYNIIIGIYTLEGDNQDVQAIEITVNRDYDNIIQVTEWGKQKEEYKINKDLKTEAKKIIEYLEKHFKNVKYEEAASY